MFSTTKMKSQTQLQQSEFATLVSSCAIRHSSVLRLDAEVQNFVSVEY